MGTNAWPTPLQIERRRQRKSQKLLQGENLELKTLARKKKDVWDITAAFQ